MKTYILSHLSALTWLISNANSRGDCISDSAGCCSRAEIPTAPHAMELHRLLGLEGRQDYMAALGAHARESLSVRPQVRACGLAPNSLIAVPCHHPEVEVYVCCPELAFVQVCQLVDRQEAIYFGNSICSDFRLEPLARGGVVFRQGSDSALTSVDRIRSYLERIEGGWGTNRAASALRHMHERARSPKECALGMLLCLPSNLGGFDLGDLSFNESISIYDGRDRYGDKKYVTRYPDLLISSRDARGELRQVAVDYDPDSTHAGGWKRVADVRRRNEFASVRDLTHFTITSGDAADFRYLESIAERISAALGRRPRPLLRCSRDSFEGRRRLADVRSKRMGLWSRLLCKSYERVIRDLPLG